jgi:hypothetical protein
MNLGEKRCDKVFIFEKLKKNWRNTRWTFKLHSEKQIRELSERDKYQMRTLKTNREVRKYTSLYLIFKYDSKIKEFVEKRFHSIMISGDIVLGMSFVSILYAYITQCCNDEDSWFFLIDH